MNLYDNFGLYLCRTFQMECPFMVKVRVTKDGQKLFVKEMCGEHNHVLTEVSLYMPSLTSIYNSHAGGVLSYA